jgi:hypothetical protein
MGFFSNVFKSVSNVAKTTVTTAKTGGYAVYGYRRACGGRVGLNSD